MTTPLSCERARIAWPILVKLARKQERITYKDLCAQDQRLGHYRSAMWFLGVIQAHCEDVKGMPRLQALVVSAREKVPGPGYRGSRETPEHTEEIRKVWAYNWSTVPPRFLPDE